MEKLLLLPFILLFILSGYSLRTTEEKFDKISIEELPNKYLPDMAVENGDYVDLHGEISNKNVMIDFLEKVENHKEAYIRTVQYTIEGDPLINDFYYNKGKYMVTIDMTRDAWSGENSIREKKEFKYLKTFEFDNYIYLIVTNLEEIKADRFPGEDSVILKYESIN